MSRQLSFLGDHDTRANSSAHISDERPSVREPRKRWRLGKGGLARFPIAFLAITVLLTGHATAQSRQATRPTGLPAVVPLDCASGPHAIHRADELLANRYRLGPHPTVTLPADPTWAEDPLHDVNWQVFYHGLSYVLALTEAWTLTGDARYARRATFLLDDWIHDNPRSHPPSRYSWYDQTTARRASVMTCAARIMGMTSTLRRALLLHGALLADPGFYRWVGNHALDQNIGLLDAGDVLGRPAWLDLARRRLALLVTQSVSRAGVINEQSVGYELYNYLHYTRAAERLATYGRTIPSGFARITDMPAFLAYATLPNGEYETIGDTDRKHAAVIPGTVAEFAATQGASGPMPPSTDALYRSEGWLFVRTGWGLERPYADEVAYTLRFGPAAVLHGHQDGGSLTLYGYGSSLVVDPGKFTYDAGPMRTYFTGRTAHNVVTVDGLTFDDAPTLLLSQRASVRRVDTTVTTDGDPGVHSQRRVDLLETTRVPAHRGPDDFAAGAPLSPDMAPARGCGPHRPR